MPKALSRERRMEQQKILIELSFTNVKTASGVSILGDTDG